jgi:hypothetical protein
MSAVPYAAPVDDKADCEVHLFSLGMIREDRDRTGCPDAKLRRETMACRITHNKNSVP